MNTALKVGKIFTSTTQIKPTVISASGIYLPKNKIKSEELMAEIKSEKNYGVSERWMNDIIGIKERRFCSDSETPSSIAIKAAKMALGQLKSIPKIDKIIFCSIDKDHCEPATAHTVNKALGLGANEVYDVTDACFGFMRGVEDCVRAIALGQIANALVVTGETPSKGIHNIVEQLRGGVDKGTFNRMLPFLTAGDAAGAFVLSAGDSLYGSGFNRLITRTDSNLYDKCCYKRDYDGNIVGQMKMGHLTAHGRRMYQSIGREVSEDPFLTEDDHVVFHGTGNGSFDVLLQNSPVPKNKWIKTFHELGNITSASFPVGFHKLKETQQLSPGDKVGCYINGSGLVAGYRQYAI